MVTKLQRVALGWNVAQKTNHNPSSRILRCMKIKRLKNLLTIFNLHKMEMSCKAFQHDSSEIMFKPINGSSYSSLAKYLSLCVSLTAIIMATTALLFYLIE